MNTAVAFVYVADIDRSIGFYGETLGLKIIDTDPYGALAAADGGLVRLTKMPGHPPHEHPVFGLHVADFGGVFAALREKGVRFTLYEGMTDEQGICRGGDGKAMAWFNDPDGNVLMLSEA